MEESGTLRALIERNFGFAWVIGIVMAAATVAFSIINELPIRDPESLLPGYIRFPAIVLGAILVDIVPRALWRARHRLRSLPTRWREVVHERWPASHWLFAVGGVSAWYLSYAAFRNLKSMAPFINGRSWDNQLATLDKEIWFGHDPAAVLHQIFGTGLAAHFFSTVYFIWIALIPVSIAVALVWTRHTRAGSWYVTALTFDWFLGALFYILIPTVGPVFHAGQRGLFAGLPETYNTRLGNSMWADRIDVLDDRFASGTLQTIAAFPSLHVGMMVTICLVVQYIGLARWMRVASWIFLGLTVLATIYLGWHYFIDVIAGAAVGSVSVWAGALATGNHVGLRPRLNRTEASPLRRSDQPVSG